MHILIVSSCSETTGLMRRQLHLLASVDDVFCIGQPVYAWPPDHRMVSRGGVGHFHGAELQEGLPKSDSAEQHLPERSENRGQTPPVPWYAPLQPGLATTLATGPVTCGTGSRTGLCVSDNRSLLRCRRHTGCSLMNSLRSRSPLQTSHQCKRGARQSLYG